MTMWRFLAVAALTCSPWIVADASAGGPTPLGQALHEGKLKLEIRARGSSTGDVILIQVQRLVPETLRLTLRPGTVLTSVSGSTQDMVVARVKGEPVDELRYRPVPEIVLADDSPRTYLIEAYCLDFHKANPSPGQMFSLSHVDGRAATIIETGLQRGASIGVIQSALWIDREAVTNAELRRRFPVGEEDLQAARALLRPSTERERTGVTRTRDRASGVLAPALRRFFDLMRDTPSRADGALGKLHEDLEGREVALVFGLEPSGDPSRLALSSPRNLGDVARGEFLILSGETMLEVVQGDVSAAVRQELLLTGTAHLRLPGEAPEQRAVAYSFVVAHLESPSAARAVATIDIVDATWRRLSPPDSASAVLDEQRARLRSADAKDRADAIVAIGEMGAQAAPAVPQLVALLGEDVLVATSAPWQPARRLRYDPAARRSPRGGELVKPVSVRPLGSLAADALVDIGEPAIAPLIAALQDANHTAASSSVSSRDAAAARTAAANASSALKKLSGRDYGSDHTRWQAWWRERR